MAEIINLRRARKARARSEQAAQADAHRALHGRTRAEAAGQKLEHERAERLLDLAKTEDAPTE